MSKRRMTKREDAYVRSMRQRWRGGKTFNTPNRVREAFASIKGWSVIRADVLQRDGVRCRICGEGDEFGSLNVHHIDWDRSHNEPGNLVTLCQQCHQAIHREGYKPELYEDWPAPWGNLE